MSRSKREPKATVQETMTTFVPAQESLFDLHAAGMNRDGWELVAVVGTERYTTTAVGSGVTRGWQCFWKRQHKGAVS